MEAAGDEAMAEESAPMVDEAGDDAAVIAEPTPDLFDDAKGEQAGGEEPAPKGEDTVDEKPAPGVENAVGIVPASSDSDEDAGSQARASKRRRVEEKEQASPKPSPSAASGSDAEGAAEVQDKDSDDEWGIDFGKGSSGALLPTMFDGGEEAGVDIVQRIQQDRQAAVEKLKEMQEKLDAQRAAPDEEDLEWNMYGWNTEAVDEEDEDDIDYLKSEVTAETEWRRWPVNSAEALAATALIHKIRGRTRTCKKILVEREFPSPELEDSFNHIMTTQRENKQYCLIVALLWTEATLLESPTGQVPSELNANAKALIEEDHNMGALTVVSRRVSRGQLRTRACAGMPTLETRQRAMDVVLPLLIQRLYEEIMIQGGAEDINKKADLEEVIEEFLAGLPLSVQLSCLSHVFECAHLERNAFDSKEAVGLAITKQLIAERMFETVCRLTLKEACDLAESLCMDEGEEVKASVENMRKQKINTLNRLSSLCGLKPTEDELWPLHQVRMETQLQVLLNVERDIEDFVGRDKDRGLLRKFLNFDGLVKPHLYRGLHPAPVAPGRVKGIENESGMRLSVYECAQVRHKCGDVLRAIRLNYGWKPDEKSRKVIARTHWPARLSALLKLATKTTCLHADQELRVFLMREQSRKLGSEVLERFEAWAKLEEGGFTKNLRAPIYLSKEESEARRKKYREYQPEVKQVFNPMTPAAMGFAPGTPGLVPGRTPAGPPPATPGVMPMRAAGTPSGPPPATPGLNMRRAAGTPSGPPPATPGVNMRYASATPAGPPPATPSIGALPMRAAGTPAGPPPATPGVFTMRAAGTPAGPPPATPGIGMRAAGTPAGPPPAVPGGPATPVGAVAPATPGPSTPMPVGPGTPGAAGPSTPMPAVAGTPGGALGPGPATPMPLGPGPATPVPMGPGPATPVPLGPGPATPAGPGPATPAGPGPATPAAA